MAMVEGGEAMVVRVSVEIMERLLWDWEPGEDACCVNCRKAVVVALTEERGPMVQCQAGHQSRKKSRIPWVRLVRRKPLGFDGAGRCKDFELAEA